MTPKLTCREFIEFLSDYVAGELRAHTRATFNAHLAWCPPCVIYAKTYLESVRLGQAAIRGSDEPVPGDMPEELVRAILAARHERP